jgi:hypothetical protein
VLIAGHFPHLPALLELLHGGADAVAPFPPHGVVAFSTEDEGRSWTEMWRIDARCEIT